MIKGAYYLSGADAFSQQVIVSNQDWLLAILGTNDKYVRLLEENFDIQVSNRGEVITISGKEEDVEMTRAIMLNLVELLERGITPRTMDIITAVKMAKMVPLNISLTYLKKSSVEHMTEQRFVRKILDNYNMSEQLNLTMWCLELVLQVQGRPS